MTPETEPSGLPGVSSKSEISPSATHLVMTISRDVRAPLHDGKG